MFPRTFPAHQRDTIVTRALRTAIFFAIDHKSGLQEILLIGLSEGFIKLSPRLVLCESLISNI